MYLRVSLFQRGKTPNYITVLEVIKFIKGELQITKILLNFTVLIVVNSKINKQFQTLSKQGGTIKNLKFF